MMTKNCIYKITALIAMVIFVSGCAGFQSMSSYARTGDTIAVALGATEDSNLLVDILNKDDVTVTITDSNSNTYQVSLRNLARLYPDNSSTYIFNTDKDNSGPYFDAYAPPLAGQVFATIDLVEPGGSYPPLTAGPATISVSAAGKLNQTLYYGAGGASWDWSNGNLAEIDIEILPGTGTPHNLSYLAPVTYDPLPDLEPLPQIMVSPSGTPADVIAGGSFSFIYTDADFSGGLKAVPANHDPNVHFMSNITDLGDGTKRMDVIILNPRGFLVDNNRTNVPEASVNGMGIGKMSPLRSARFSLVFKGDAIANDEASWSNSIVSWSGNYIDLQGNDVLDISAQLTKAH